MSDACLHCAIRDLIRSHAEEHGDAGPGEAGYSAAAVAVALGPVLGDEMARVPLAERPGLVAHFVGASNSALRMASPAPGERRH